jgi:hypothetical protein
MGCGTYATAARHSQPVPRAQPTPRAQPATAQRSQHGLVDTVKERLMHILQVPAGTITAQQRGLRPAMRAFLKSHMPKAVFKIATCGRIASKTLQNGTAVDRYLITVPDLEDAASLVYNRCNLKGTGCTLFDVLTREECADHQRLLGRFHSAQARGAPTQFRRARLFVDGLEVLP